MELSGKLKLLMDEVIAQVVRCQYVSSVRMITVKVYFV